MIDIPQTHGRGTCTFQQGLLARKLEHSLLWRFSHLLQVNRGRHLHPAVEECPDTTSWIPLPWLHLLPDEVNKLKLHVLLYILG
jgi:hypothetical protein